MSRFWRNAFIGKEEKSITFPKQNGGHVGQLCHYAAERARTEIVIDILKFRLTSELGTKREKETTLFDTEGQFSRKELGLVAD